MTLWWEASLQQLPVLKALLKHHQKHHHQTQPTPPLQHNQPPPRQKNATLHSTIARSIFYLCESKPCAGWRRHVSRQRLPSYPSPMTARSIVTTAESHVFACLEKPKLGDANCDKLLRLPHKARRTSIKRKDQTSTRLVCQTGHRNRLLSTLLKNLPLAMFFANEGL